MTWVKLKLNLKEHFENTLDEHGYIKVNQYFQLTTQEPDEILLDDDDYFGTDKRSFQNDLVDKLINTRDSQFSKSYPNIFAFGDACRTLMKEEKSIPAIAFTADIICNNIMSHFDHREL